MEFLWILDDLYKAITDSDSKVATGFAVLLYLGVAVISVGLICVGIAGIVMMIKNGFSVFGLLLVLFILGFGVTFGYRLPDWTIVLFERFRN